jgi:hypothetical protein
MMIIIYALIFAVLFAALLWVFGWCFAYLLSRSIEQKPKPTTAEESAPRIIKRAKFKKGVAK